MSKPERGGTVATNEEAAAILSIIFSDGVGDKVRAMRAYGDARCRAVVLLLLEARGWIDKHKCCTEGRKALVSRIDEAAK